MLVTNIKFNIFPVLNVPKNNVIFVFIHVFASINSMSRIDAFNISTLSLDYKLFALFYRFSLSVSEEVDSEAILLLMMSILWLAIAARVKWQFILKNNNTIAS